MSRVAHGDAQGDGRLRSSAALRVASFNIRTGTGPDGRHGWPLRAGACAAVIAGLHADAVGLQEVRLFQERGLARRLPAYASVGAGREDGRRRGERCTVLYLRARLRLDEWVVRWLSDVPWLPASRSWGNPIPRVATLCRFTDLLTGERFGLADTHWDGASAVSRRRGAEALLSWLDPALQWLVVGDLNATAHDPAVERLGAGGLTDTLAHLEPRGPRAGTHHPWDGSTEGTRIDYVLTGPRWESLGAWIDHSRPGGRLPSDHWPVVADVRLRPAGPGRPE